jgi:integrase
MRPEEIKQHECVKRWLDTIYAQGTGSSGTQSLYPSQLCYFLNFAKLTPDELIKVAQDHPDRLKDLVNGYTRQRREQGRSDGTIVTTIAIVKSFLRESDAEVRLRGPKRPDISRRTIMKDELKSFMTYASPRLRAFVMTMKDSGMSPIDILKLKHGDIREGLETGKVPIRISMIRTKTNVAFETFLGPDGIKCLNDYLGARKRGTEKIPPETLDDNSPLFRTFKAKVKAVDYVSVFQEFSRTRKIADTKFRIYDLRRFFSANMKAAGVNDTLVEHWMGHKLPGTIDAYFFSPENQEQIYMNAYPRIALEEITLTKEMQEQQILASARVAGIPEDKVAQLKAKLQELNWSDLSDITNEDWKKIIPKMLASERKRARPRSKKKGRKKRIAKNNSNGESRYVTERQLPKFISEGWQFVAQVNGNILIKKELG